MKRSLRDYLVTLILGIVVFSVIAVFLIQAAEGLMEDVVTKIGSEADPDAEQVQTKEDPAPEKETQEAVTEEKDLSATFLLVGLDHKLRGRTQYEGRCQHG